MFRFTSFSFALSALLFLIPIGLAVVLEEYEPYQLGHGGLFKRDDYSSLDLHSDETFLWTGMSRITLVLHLANTN